jgi:serine protease inhibitor
MKTPVLLSILAVIVSISGASSGASTAGDKKATVTGPAVQANNDFACELYRNLSKENDGKNLFFSPYSISNALAMTLEGARGETAAEMGKVMGLPESLQNIGEESKILPWKTGPYHQGFADLNRRLTKPADAPKDLAVRTKMAELRDKLNKANKNITVLEKQGNFNELNKALDEARKLADGFNALAKQVDQYELRVANAVWGEKTYPFEPAYLAAIEKYYGRDLLRNADFKNQFPKERATINGWVEEQTNKRIKDLIPDYPPAVARLVRMILVNAIYFKGQWATPFDRKQTKDDTFFLGNGGNTKVPLMYIHHGQTSYAAFNADGSLFDTPKTIPIQDGDKVKKYPAGDGFLMVELPVKGDKLSMVVLAPQKTDGLAALEARLTGKNLASWIGKLQKRSVEATLARFKMDTDYSLGETLQKMGMKLAFQERIADFTGMSASRNPDDRLYISKVLHKAFVEVNEEGAEAAAATAVIMLAPTGAPVNLPFNPSFRADRPFLFLIRDMESGAVLFLGRVTQPKA